MKQKQADKLAEKIYNNMYPRLIELVERVEKNNCNPAYIVAFHIGLCADISHILKKIKLKEDRGNEL